jgi:hypothetical protein
VYLSDSSFITFVLSTLLSSSLYTQHQTIHESRKEYIPIYSEYRSCFNKYFINSTSERENEQNRTKPDKHELAKEKGRKGKVFITASIWELASSGGGRVHCKQQQIGYISSSPISVSINSQQWQKDLASTA